MRVFLYRYRDIEQKNSISDYSRIHSKKAVAARRHSESLRRVTALFHPSSFACKLIVFKLFRSETDFMT